MTSKYTFELWTSTGTLLADLSSRAKERHVTRSRNEADEISWQLDLAEFERFCAKLGQDPRDLLIAGQTEVRIRRGERYLSAGRIDYVSPSVDGVRQLVDIRASGFLNFFQNRFTDEVTFTAVEGPTIAASLITATQSKGADWDFGVTIGTLATTGPLNRTYQQDVTAIKDAIQGMTRVQTRPFDIEITPDKVFNTYAAIGNSRPDVIFEFPGNIKSLSAPIDATRVANFISAYGSGFGTEAQERYVAEDYSSQATYKVRQKQLTANATDESDDSLPDMAESEKAAWAWPFQIPALVVNGNVAPFIGDYDIGDYIRVDCSASPYKMFQHINGLYRLEKYELSVDDNDNEEITLYVSA